jgi:hypothetical protein
MPTVNPLVPDVLLKWHYIQFIFFLKLLVTYGSSCARTNADCVAILF